MHCFPLLRRQMVVQNLFEAVRKSFSMASPNSSHVRNRHSCAPLGLPVPACCLRSPTGQKGPIGLLLQFDSIPHRRCPPAGSGIAATAGTDHLAATAPVGRLNNGGAEHGPLGLNVPRLPRYVATPEWKRVQPLSRRLVPEPLLCVEVRPTISSRNFSTSRTSSGTFPTREVTFHVPRASFCSQGSDRQAGGKGFPRLRFGLCPAGPHGNRPGHQALAPEPHPQAWLQGGAPVTHVRARDTYTSTLEPATFRLPDDLQLPPELRPPRCVCPATVSQLLASPFVSVHIHLSPLNKITRMSSKIIGLDQESLSQQTDKGCYQGARMHSLAPYVGDTQMCTNHNLMGPTIHHNRRSSEMPSQLTTTTGMVIQMNSGGPSPEILLRQSPPTRRTAPQQAGRRDGDS
ncbi:hypothetical protein N1851_022012 [Merluccius polli]|uniref:Uncharacterized protein n=1 Tax=Merluccius polli TaxID=89951 RepID=A0AA47NYX1_MERPO|nr:hypothetical protein N1851_022012 [Merluccius polli]